MSTNYYKSHRDPTKKSIGKGDSIVSYSNEMTVILICFMQYFSKRGTAITWKFARDNNNSLNILTSPGAAAR